MSPIPESLRSALQEHYALERELGRGGMATVYLAQDLRHNRPVAVKVLRPELAASMGSERFLREIQIAARLSHPHILPLHDSGEAHGVLYYVMPYVDGESLRARLARQGELPVPEAARILREVADALAYAHERGVVHRDIKPDNVLLSGRHALVTDFGVAKAVSEATGRQALTTEGFALGTPSYMAPEQAVADPHVDHRADLYALGAMGYELLTGRPPFVAANAREVLAAHVASTAQPISSLRPSCPPALAAMIMRCLEKNPADRPQTAEELVPLLEAAATPSSGITPTDTLPLPAAGRRPTRSLLAAGVALLAGALFWALSTKGTQPVVLGAQSRITDLPGLETDPVLSPDGRFVAYSAGPYYGAHIYVKQLSGGPALDLTPSLPGRHTRPRWGPGGSEVLFVSRDGRTRRVSRISALGGQPRSMVELESNDAIVSADWSPDGKRIAYDLGSTIYLAAVDGGAPVPVYEGTDPHSIAWSPDGRRLAFVDGGNRLWHGATGFTNTAPSALCVISVRGGPVDTLSPPTAMNLSPSWASDGRALWFISSRDGAKDVYRVPLSRQGGPTGPAQRLTTGLNAHTVALSADGHLLVFSTLDREANVWMVPLQPGRVITDEGAVPVTTGHQVIERMTLSPDGRWLLYDSDRRGNADIYRLRLDQPGAEPEQLTSDSANDYAPAVSPDGGEIAFHSLRSGNRDLWLMKSDGSDQRPITKTPIAEYAGWWSPDGRSISFYADSASTLWLGVMSRNDTGSWGTPRLLVPGTRGTPAWSPDGAHLAAVVNDDSLVIVSWPSGETKVLYELPVGYQPSRIELWTPDGRSIYYRLREPDGRLTFVTIPVNGSPPTTLVRQRDASRSNPRSNWVTDGRRFYFTIHQYEGDVSTIEVKR